MKIPKNLKPGTKLIDNWRYMHIVAEYGRWQCGTRECVCCSDGRAYDLADGTRIIGGERIIRIEKAKAAPDAGSECVRLIKRIAMECARREDHKARKLPNHLWQQVRAIARRLNGGAA